MKTNRFFCVFSLLVIVMAFAKIVVGLHFWVIPPVFFAVGLGAGLWNREYALYLFLFLFPFISIAPGLIDSRYPFNYIAIPLFLLSGIVVATVIQKLRGGEGTGDNIDVDFIPYYLFLSFLVISTVFVLLRWTNITLGSDGAMGMDTPAAPPAPDITSPDQLKWMEQRVSFASIFPVVSLFIYFISPYIFFYIRKITPRQEDVFKWLSYGFWVSVGIAVVQKISNRSLVSDRLGKELKQFYGGSSDFNSFGFFAGVMLLWATYEIKKKNVVGYISFIVALAGGILSGSRTFYFFILAGVVNLLFWGVGTRGTGANRGKYQKIVIAGIIVVVLLVVIFAGGTLAKRFGEGFSGDEGLVKKLDTITNGRVRMGLFTVETIKDNFLPGVGTGNFTFYLAYKNYLPLKEEGKKYLYDLTLNQYALVFAENGVFAFVFFTFFMIFLFRRSGKKLLLGTILFSLLLNNFFWFPEAFLLFWIVAALNHTGPETEKKKYPYTKILVGVSLLIFIVFNIVSFDRLHPKTWAKETGVHYNYGFWYPEKNAEGEEYRWTKARSGIHLQLDKNGESPEIKLVCGAPLAHVKGKTQTVEIYWKGNFCREVTFTENNEIYYRIKSQPFEEGFLEFKVSPAFNLKKLGLSPESRDLGLQFFIL